MPVRAQPRTAFLPKDIEVLNDAKEKVGESIVVPEYK